MIEVEDEIYKLTISHPIIINVYINGLRCNVTVTKKGVCISHKDKKGKYTIISEWNSLYKQFQEMKNGD